MTESFAQARDNKLTIEDMAGGSFTISNVSYVCYLCGSFDLTYAQGGVFGSLMGTPIINLPQTGKIVQMRFLMFRQSDIKSSCPGSTRNQRKACSD